MKIKCVKFECEVCHNLATIQIFYNKSGSIKYARIRHYLRRENNKPQFEYHQQALQYIMGHIGQAVNVDLVKPQISLN